MQSLTPSGCRWNRLNRLQATLLLPRSASRTCATIHSSCSPSSSLSCRRLRLPCPSSGARLEEPISIESMSASIPARCASADQRRGQVANTKGSRQLRSRHRLQRHILATFAQNVCTLEPAIATCETPLPLSSFLYHNPHPTCDGLRHLPLSRIRVWELDRARARVTSNEKRGHLSPII